MPQSSAGCYTCFRTLDPRDPEPRLRAFVKCSKCDAHYHTTCWQKEERCLRCGETKIAPVRVRRPARQGKLRLRRSQAMEPEEIIDAEGEEPNKLPTIRQFAVYLAQSTWSAGLALLLIGISAFLALLIVRNVLDVYGIQLPPRFMEAGSLMSAWLAGTAFMSRLHTGGRRFVYIIAAAIALIAYDLWLLVISPLDFFSDPSFVLSQAPQFFLAQGIAAGLALLSVPLHRGLSGVKPLRQYRPPQWLLTLYGTLRLIIVSVPLMLTILYLTAYWIQDEGILPMWWEHMSYYDFSWPPSKLYAYLLAAVATIVIIAALLYWPPSFRLVRPRWIIVRALLIISSICVLILLYATGLYAPPTILWVMVHAGAFAIASVPVQRALS